MTSHYFLPLVILSLIILLKNIVDCHEGFSTSNSFGTPKLLLLGDSILENCNYASPCIKELLSAHSQVTSYAQDNATIQDIYNQLKQIKRTDDLSQTILFLSVGGNDLLKGNINAKTEYLELITTIRQVIQTPLYVLNLYYPPNAKQYYTLIKEWNSFLVQNQFKILDISNLLTDPNDFTFTIEPSVTGGGKIAAAILEAATVATP